MKTRKEAKKNNIMKAIDFLTVTKANEVKYSNYILFKEGEAVTVDMFGGAPPPLPDWSRELFPLTPQWSACTAARITVNCWAT